MSDRIYFWKSIDETQHDCFGVYQGISEDLVGILDQKKLASDISITDITNGVLSDYGWKSGSMEDAPFTIHIDGCSGHSMRGKGHASTLKGRSAKQGRQKQSVDENGNVIPKPPRKPSAYNLFVKDKMEYVKQQHPELQHKELFAKLAELWDLEKNAHRYDEDDAYE